MFYETYGEFEVPYKAGKGGKIVFKEGLNKFWNDLDEKHRSLSIGRGCYIFAIRASKGMKPWYVGQTKKTFRDECFQPTKLNHYNNVLSNTAKGTPVLILVARHTPKGKFSKNLNVKEADFVEQLFITHALSKNNDLMNKKDTRFLRDLQIPGVLNSPKGKPSVGAKLLKSLLGTK